MRLWSLHPRYLDPQGLVALWRESLLAQAVLRGETRGYRHHPQLARFQACPAPLSAISHYLQAIYDDAEMRGYHFDKKKIRPARKLLLLQVTEGQLQYEWSHLLAKLQQRSPALYRQWRKHDTIEAHPLFQTAPGPIADWERQ